jgi:peptidylprolyl isomerase
MPQAANGDKVKVHYTGRLDDDTVFDSSRERGPLEFELGSGQVIRGFEEAVIGMEPGEQISARIEPAKAYGPRVEELKIRIDSDALPDDLDPSPGDHLRMRTQDGNVVPVTVAEVSDEGVIVDANHPLAGQALTFDIELVEIV